MYYNRLGEKITDEEFGELSRDIDYKTIGRDKVENFLISTIWLGIDHSFNFSEEKVPLLLFETMVFLDNDPSGCYQERYTTEAEAIMGHNKIKEKIIAKDYGDLVLEEEEEME